MPESLRLSAMRIQWAGRWAEGLGLCKVREDRAISQVLFSSGGFFRVFRLARPRVIK